MKMTTLNIIKILPIDKVLQMKLVSQFDLLSPDQKFELEQIIWDAYEAIYKLKLQENLQLAFLKVKTKEEKLDKEFYARAKKLTEQQMENYFTHGADVTDISDVISKLKSLVMDKSSS